MAESEKGKFVFEPPKPFKIVTLARTVRIFVRTGNSRMLHVVTEKGITVAVLAGQTLKLGVPELLEYDHRAQTVYPVLNEDGDDQSGVFVLAEEL